MYQRSNDVRAQMKKHLAFAKPTLILISRLEARPKLMRANNSEFLLECATFGRGLYEADVAHRRLRQHA